MTWRQGDKFMMTMGLINDYKGTSWYDEEKNWFMIQMSRNCDGAPLQSRLWWSRSQCLLNAMHLDRDGVPSWSWLWWSRLRWLLNAMRLNCDGAPSRSHLWWSQSWWVLNVMHLDCDGAPSQSWLWWSWSQWTMVLGCNGSWLQLCSIMSAMRKMCEKHTWQC